MRRGGARSTGGTWDGDRMLMGESEADFKRRVRNVKF